MPEEILLGSIELVSQHSVRWVRVTNAEGWALVLLRLLTELNAGSEAQLVKLLSVEEGHFKEALSFRVP